MKQVDSSAYVFERYVGLDRWESFYCQVREALALQPKSILEVGGATGVFGSYIKKVGISYTSVDIAEDLAPDLVGDVRALPVENAAFDVACAFEVLEHIPFSDFDTALRELARVSKGAVLISLPYFGPPVKILFKFPFLPEIRLALKIPYPRTHVFDGEHYWEIGKRGYPLSRVRRAIKKHFAIEKEYTPFGNQYHRFFVLRKL